MPAARIILPLSCFLAVGLLANGEQLELNWDNTPPLRSGPLAGYSRIVKKAAPSVVAVVVAVRDAAGPSGFTLPGSPDFHVDGVGSGVILSADGFVLTNSHVVEFAEAIRVMVPGQDKPQIAKLVGLDELTDIAVIKLDAAGLPAARLAGNADLEVGDLVLTIGNPFGLEHTVTSGIVSGLGRKNLSANLYENFIQTDAAINPGSSGGALIDNRGRVIGIIGAMVSDDGHNAGVGFAEPIRSAVEIARALIADGEIQRGYVGLEFAELTPPLADVFGLGENGGALIAEVSPGSPAEAAELEPGDVIVRFEKTKIADSRQLELLIAECDPNVTRDLEIVRFGKSVRTEIKIAPAPNPRSKGRREDTIPTGDTLLPGLNLANLDAGSRIYFGVPPEISGVIVIEVDPRSAAADAGIAEGDVILQIGREPVASLGQAQLAAEKLSGDKILLRLLGWEGVKFALLTNPDQQKPQPKATRP